MAKLKRGLKRRLILDMGASAVRVCELSRTKTGYQLTKYHQVEFDSDPGLSDVERRKVRAKALENVLKESKIRSKKTILAVPGQSVFTRSRTLPPVPEYKVNQIVRYEIQQQIPFSLDQIAMDYQILDRSEAGGYEVMMAAIKVDVVEKHLDILRDAKRSIDVVDVCPFAAYNWLKHTGEFSGASECVALVDIGASKTDIIIERENQFRFTRPLNVGGNDITMAIAAEFNMTFSDAERLKRQRGFAPTGDPKVDGKGAKVIGDILQRMVNEIMRSFAYFRSLPGGGTVNRVILCGGGACLRNMVPYMQGALGTDVRIAQPLSGLAVAPGAQTASEHPEQACVVLGLALRCAETVPIEINLIPPRVVEAARRREQAFYWLLIFATFALILASIIPISANQNEMVKARIRKLQSALTAYDPAFADDTKRSFAQSEVKSDLEKVQLAVKQPLDEWRALSFAYRRCNFWIDALMMLSEARPSASDIWFTTFQTATAAEVQQGRRGANAPAAARPQAGGRGRQPVVAAMKGFEGVEMPPEMLNPSSGGGGGRSRTQSGGSSGGGGGGIPVYGIPQPKGFMLTGYARNPGVILQFVENLKNASVRLPTMQFMWVTDVQFDDRDVDKFPLAVMWDPTAREVDQFAQKENILYSYKLTITFEMGAELRKTPAAPAGGAADEQPAPAEPPAAAGPATTPQNEASS